MAKVGISIPVYHSSDILYDFTKQTVESIKSKENKINLYIIVNFSYPNLYPDAKKYHLSSAIQEVKVLDNPKGNEVGASWNYGIKTGLEDGCDYVMVLNNDLILNKDCVDNLVKFAEENSDYLMWTASEWLKKETLSQAGNDFAFSEFPNFSFFMVNQKTIDTVGWFDENLKMAYHEDGDYHYRVLLSKNKTAKTESAKFYHYRSRTIKVDEDIYDKNRRSYEDNRTYIQKKWGIDFHEKVYVPPESMINEGYKYPFNDKSKSWKDW
jgi:GT2 family glycosyltransferase